MTTEPTTGPLTGLRVIELSSELGAWAGKLMADLGAEVILVEPPGGDATRRYGPFVDDVPDPDRSLWFWSYNTSKRGVVLDLESEEGRGSLRRLVAGADFLLEGERPGRLAALGLDYAALRPVNERLIMISVTPFGQSGPRAEEQAVDLTILSGGGAVWSCGYDDHTLPPARGGGNQGYQTACHFAVMSALVALLHRDLTGEGQHIDVNAHAATNVTTEAGSYAWLVARQTVQRQTGRHATFIAPTQSTQVRAADGRFVSTGLGVRKQEEYQMLREWMQQTGLWESFGSQAVLEWAIEEPIPDRMAMDDASMAKRAAGRDAVVHLATNMPSYDFFIGGQARGMQVSVIYSPEEVLSDPHMVERGFPTPVHHESLGRDVTYPGVPYLFHRTPARIRGRAPLLGEHSAEVLAEVADGGR